MTEYTIIEKEFIQRLAEMLPRGRAQHDATQAFAYCAALTNWSVQRMRADDYRCAYEKEMKRVCVKKHLGLKLVENPQFTGTSSFETDCTKKVLEAMRNCFSHLDERRIEAVNDAGNLTHLKFYLHPQTTRSTSTDDFSHFVVLDKGRVIKFGQEVANIFSRVASAPRESTPSSPT